MNTIETPKQSKPGTRKSPMTSSNQISRKHNLSFAGAVKSEWIKLLTVRSSIWCFIALVTFGVGITAIIAANIKANLGPGDLGSRWGLSIAVTTPQSISILIVMVLGVIMIGGEYGTGMIRSTLTAIPKRVPALLAKSIVLFSATFIVTLFSTLVAYFIAKAIIGNTLEPTGLFDNNYYLVFLGAATYFGLASVFALALGTIVRSTAAGISIAVALVLIVPGLLQIPILPKDFQNAVIPHMLPNAGASLFDEIALRAPIPPGAPVPLDNIAALITVALWAIIPLIGAAMLLKSRDA